MANLMAPALMLSIWALTIHFKKEGKELREGIEGKE